MNIEAPTFNALNKPQKRALILRDQLRFVDPHHLNSFLDGVSNAEPPTYTNIHGTIKPALALVTLKPDATRFDLGNVLFPSENNAVHRVYLVVENGQIDMRAEAPLPQDDAVLDSLPIHAFIAKGIVPLFRDKFQAIVARMTKINEARRAAYNGAHKAPASVHEGETLTRLNPPKASQSHASSSPPPTLTTTPPRKRPLSTPIQPHITNKRPRTNTLAALSPGTKALAVDALPQPLKTALFNSLASTALPHLDNLLTASWNVATIYAACGTDFPDLHRAIVEMRSVLCLFDEATGRTKCTSRSAESAAESERLRHPTNDDNEAASAVEDEPAVPVQNHTDDDDKQPQDHRAIKSEPETSDPLHAQASPPAADTHDREEGEISSSDEERVPHRDPRGRRGEVVSSLGWSGAGNVCTTTTTRGVAPVANMFPRLWRKEGRW